MTSSVGILNRTHDNLEKRIARIESQLGRPRSCKYGTTAERTAYGAPVEGVLWWDTTEEVLYVWYNYNWILAKGVMVGGTTARIATSLASPGGMWWDTDEDNLYVWGVSNSWQSVTGAKFGTREQRNAGGFGGIIWICSDEGYAYSYDDSAGNWRAVGESVFDLNWLYQYGGDFAIMGHRTDYSPTSSYDQKDIHKVGSYSGYLTEFADPLYTTTPPIYGQDGLVPYADFTNGVSQVHTNWPNPFSTICSLSPAGAMVADTTTYTIMVWFKIFDFANVPQPIIGSWTGTGGHYWLLYITGDSRSHNSPFTPRRLVWQGGHYGGFAVSTDVWHFAAVRNGYLKMDDSGWTSYSNPLTLNGYTRNGYLSYSLYHTYPPTTIYYAGCHLRGRISMYYAHGSIGLTEGQIDMFYERTRRLHGV